MRAAQPNTTSYWHMEPGPTPDTLSVPPKQAVFVVGSGYTGLNTALVAVHGGRSVLVLEAGRIASDTCKALYYYRANPDRKRILFGGRISAFQMDPAVSGDDDPTLTSNMFNPLRDQIDPTIASISTIMILVTTSMMVLAQIFGGNKSYE